MTPSPDRDELAAVVSGGAIVLLVGPSRTDGGIALRRDLARAIPSIPDLLVWITYDRPGSLLDDWTDHVAENPWRVAFLTLGTNDAGSVTALRASAPPDVAVAGSTARQTSDLTGIGIEITKALPDRPTAPVLVYFDSITPLAVVNDRKRVYRFVHILLQRLSAAGAVGLFHLDPSVHDEPTVATLSSVFDTVVEFDDDGWTIR